MAHAPHGFFIIQTSEMAKAGAAPDRKMACILREGGAWCFSRDGFK
jgi:hypothetical protein